MVKIEKKHIFIIIASILSLSILMFFIVKRKSDDSYIKIGILMPLTKANAQFGINTKNGIDMYIDEINNQGGINGKKIKCIEFDDEGDPAKAVSGYEFLKDKGVSAVITGASSDTSLAVVEEAHKDNIPVMVTTASADGITYNKENNKIFQNVFRIGFTNSFQGEIMAKFAQNKGAKNIAVLYSAENDYSSGLKDSFVNECNNLGLNTSVIENFSVNSVDFQAQLSNIKNKNPDLIFVPSYYEIDGLIVQQARNLGISCPIVGTDGWSGVTSTTSDVSSLNNCFYCSSFSYDDPSESSKKFSEEYEKKFGQNPNMLSAGGYDAAKVLISSVGLSLEKNLKINSDDFRKDIIENLKNTNIDCIAGNITFDKYHNPKKQAIIVQIKDGKEKFYQKF